MKKYFIVLLLSLVLFSCNKTEILPLTSNIQENSKQKISESGNSVVLEKDIISSTGEIIETGGENVNNNINMENLQKQIQTTIDNQKTLQKSDENKNQESLSQTDEITKIIQEISVYCEKYNIPECLPIISYSVVDLDDKHGVVKIGGFKYLLTKKDNEWNVSIVSQEKNICETGSDSPDLFEYCSRGKL